MPPPSTHQPRSLAHPRQPQAFLVQPVRAASDRCGTAGMHSQVSGSSSGGPLSNEGSLLELVDALRQSGLVDGGSLPLRPRSHSPLYRSAAASGAGSRASQLRMAGMRAQSAPAPQHGQAFGEEEEEESEGGSGTLQQPAGGSCGMYLAGSDLGAGLASIGPTISAAGPSLSFASLVADPFSPRAVVPGSAGTPEAAAAAAVAAAAAGDPQLQATASGSTFNAWLGAVGGLGLPITPYEKRRSLEFCPGMFELHCALRSWDLLCGV